MEILRAILKWLKEDLIYVEYTRYADDHEEKKFKIHPALFVVVIILLAIGARCFF